jgi:cytochrome c biogenesis factor
MGTQRPAHVVYLTAVLATSLILAFGLRIAPTMALLVAGLPVYLSASLYGLFGGREGSLILWFLCLLAVFLCLLLLTLPTLGAMLSRGQTARACLVAQVVVLILYFLLNALVVLRPH